MRDALIVALLVLSSLARAEDKGQDETIAPREGCARAYGEVKWWPPATAELRLVLAELASKTCETFIVPRALAGQKVTLALDGDAPSEAELSARVRGALRARGFVFVRSYGLSSGDAERVQRFDAPTPDRALSDAELDKGIRCADKKCTVSRKILDGMLGDSMGMARSARIVPAIADGKPVGFRLFAIRPDSYFARLGLQNGDTIRSVNGYDMTSPDKALEVYTKLRTAESVKLDIERRGEKVTLEYRLQ